MRRTGSVAAALASALATVSCSPQVAEAPAPAGAPESLAVHPVSGLAIVPVTITTAQGVHTIRAELAESAAAQRRGLMFRTEMGANEGMLFDYSHDPHVLSFWMKNTVLPLDLVFIDPDGRVLNIAAGAVPYSEAPIVSSGIAAATLELNAGRAAELGIEPGDRVEW